MKDLLPCSYVMVMCNVHERLDGEKLLTNPKCPETYNVNTQLESIHVERAINLHRDHRITNDYYRNVIK